MIEVVGYVASFCCIIAFLPQILKAVQTKSMKDVSIGLLLLLLFGNILWMLYSIVLSLVPVFVTNLAISVQIVISLVLKRVYNSNGDNNER